MRVFKERILIQTMVLVVLFIGINSSNAEILFRVSSVKSDYKADHNQTCINEFGLGWEEADWTDLQNYYTSGADMADLIISSGLDEKKSAWVTRNGDQSYSSTRDYFTSYHNHNKPDYYLAHDNIDNYFLSLGSWDGSYYVLCKNDGGTILQPPPKVFSLCVGVDYSDEDVSIISGESLGKWQDGPDGKRWAQLMYDKIKRTTSNWSPDNLSGPVILPEKEDPSHTNLDILNEAITSIQKNISSGDTLILYFLGHGDSASQDQLDEYGGEITMSPGDEYLVLEQSASVSKGFRDDYLTKILEKSEWKNINKVIMLDACHSGGFMNDASSSADVGDLEKISKIRFMSSAEEDEVGWYETNSGEPVASYLWYMMLNEVLGVDHKESLAGMLENSTLLSRFLGLLVSGLLRMM